MQCIVGAECLSLCGRGRDPNPLLACAVRPQFLLEEAKGGDDGFKYNRSPHAFLMALLVQEVIRAPINALAKMVRARPSLVCGVGVEVPPFPSHSRVCERCHITTTAAATTTGEGVSACVLLRVPAAGSIRHAAPRQDAGSGVPCMSSTAAAARVLCLTRDAGVTPGHRAVAGTHCRRSAASRTFSAHPPATSQGG